MVMSYERANQSRAIFFTDQIGSNYVLQVHSNTKL